MTLKINDNGTDREMTTEEETAHKAWQKIEQNEANAQAQVAADRQALKTATLAKLGLTADEVASLLS
jgi:hypothetical protein